MCAKNKLTHYSFFLFCSCLCYNIYFVFWFTSPIQRENVHTRKKGWKVSTRQKMAASPPLPAAAAADKISRTLTKGMGTDNQSFLKSV